MKDIRAASDDQPLSLNLSILNLPTISLHFLFQSVPELLTAKYRTKRRRLLNIEKKILMMIHFKSVANLDKLNQR